MKVNLLKKVIISAKAKAACDELTHALLNLFYISDLNRAKQRIASFLSLTNTLPEEWLIKLQIAKPSSG
jgi:hypothetical protein